MQALDGILPSFANLQILTLIRSSRMIPGIKMAELDLEFDTMLTWGRLCPKLVVCILPCVLYALQKCALAPDGASLLTFGALVALYV